MPPEDQVEEFFNHHICKPERNQGDGLKVIDKLPIKLNVYDDKACFFAMVDPTIDSFSLTMVVAEHKALILSFRMLFESIWEKAKNYYYFKGKKYYLTEDRDDEENDE
jgi:hypothetical protein